MAYLQIKGANKQCFNWFIVLVSQVFISLVRITVSSVMAMNGCEDSIIVSPSLIKWKPVFIKQFDLGIGEEWLPQVGVGADETIDEPSEELVELTSDLTEWLSNLPDVGSTMDCDDSDGMFWKVMQLDAIENTDTASDDWSCNRVVKPPTKRLKLSLASSRRKGKRAESKMLTTTAPLQDCANQSFHCSSEFS